MILKSSSKSKGIYGKIVGVIFPMELHSYFSLFALANGLTKTTVIKNQMEQWRDNMILFDLGKEENLIKDLVFKIESEWDLVKDAQSLANFKRELKQELQKKGISEEHIKTILKGI